MDEAPTNKPADPFDRVANRYEQYVPWESRLAREIPFLTARLRSAGAKRVLDCACGPGRHAVALAREHFEVTGLDASPEMLALARAHARDAQLDIPFIEGRFESLPEKLHGRFDGLLCLGNSLSAAKSSEGLGAVVGQFAAALRPGGIAMTQTVDFSVAAKDDVTPTPARFIREGDNELVFVKSFLRVGDHLCIHWTSLEKRGEDWVSEVTCREVTPVDPALLQEAFGRAGFTRIDAFGDYAGHPFVQGESRDLVLVAHRGAS